MITHEIATEQALRLKILDKYPKNQDGENALIKALEESCETRFVAERFVSGWIRTQKRCPMPCDVYQSLDTPGKLKSGLKSLPKVPMGQDVPPPEYKCNLCEDTGWYIVEMKEEIPDLPGEHYTGAKRCAHPERWKGTKL
jgi:hypothetical protein